MRLHVHEWGSPEAPPVVCVHGVTGFGGRYRQLAEERWAARFHVIAPDLRGHGHSGWEPPWTFETHVADLIETIDALGLEQPDWVGHSFGGRLVVELAARHPERIRRAVLLDPALQILPHVAETIAQLEEAEPVWDTVEDYVASRDDAGGMDRDRARRDLVHHVDTLDDGRVRRRTSQDAVVSIYRELATKPPPPDVLTIPTLLVHAPAYGLVRAEHLVYGSEALAVEGMHMVMWSVFDDVATAVEAFLR
ncbi:MAG TPA: alpha/beta hydrolase [Gaiellaceae bacterium]|nr:alpha/beta hydrolase [Gaiellaceae bacterium]